MWIIGHPWLSLSPALPRPAPQLASCEEVSGTLAGSMARSSWSYPFNQASLRPVSDRNARNVCEDVQVCDRGLFSTNNVLRTCHIEFLTTRQFQKWLSRITGLINWTSDPFNSTPCLHYNSGGRRIHTASAR